MSPKAKLSEALENAALAGALEIQEFLTNGGGEEPKSLKRVQIAVAAVSGYTRYQASRNNMASVMLMAARQSGVSTSDVLQIAKGVGLLPESTEANSKEESEK